MTVKIRLARGGAKKHPHYRLVVADARAPRDGNFIEKVGTYDPFAIEGKAQRVTLQKDRIAYWLSVGAVPTDRVALFLKQEGVQLPACITKKMEIREKSWTVKPSKKELKAQTK